MKAEVEQDLGDACADSPRAQRKDRERTGGRGRSPPRESRHIKGDHRRRKRRSEDNHNILKHPVSPWRPNTCPLMSDSSPSSHQADHLLWYLHRNRGETTEDLAEYRPECPTLFHSPTHFSPPPPQLSPTVSLTTFPQQLQQNQAAEKGTSNPPPQPEGTLKAEPGPAWWEALDTESAPPPAPLAHLPVSTPSLPLPPPPLMASALPSGTQGALLPTSHMKGSVPSGCGSSPRRVWREMKSHLGVAVSSPAPFYYRDAGKEKRRSPKRKSPRRGERTREVPISPHRVPRRSAQRKPIDAEATSHRILYDQEDEVGEEESQVEEEERERALFQKPYRESEVPLPSLFLHGGDNTDQVDLKAKILYGQSRPRGDSSRQQSSEEFMELLRKEWARREKRLRRELLAAAAVDVPGSVSLCSSEELSDSPRGGRGRTERRQTKKEEKGRRKYSRRKQHPRQNRPPHGISLRDPSASADFVLSDSLCSPLSPLFDTGMVRQPQRDHRRRRRKHSRTHRGANTERIRERPCSSSSCESSGERRRRMRRSTESERRHSRTRSRRRRRRERDSHSHTPIRPMVADPNDRDPSRRVTEEDALLERLLARLIRLGGRQGLNPISGRPPKGPLADKDVPPYSSSIESTDEEEEYEHEDKPPNRLVPQTLSMHPQTIEEEDTLSASPTRWPQEGYSSRRQKQNNQNNRHHHNGSQSSNTNENKQTERDHRTFPAHASSTSPPSMGTLPTSPNLTTPSLLPSHTANGYTPGASPPSPEAVPPPVIPSLSKLDRPPSPPKSPPKRKVQHLQSLSADENDSCGFYPFSPRSRRPPSPQQEPHFHPHSHYAPEAKEASNIPAEPGKTSGAAPAGSFSQPFSEPTPVSSPNNGTAPDWWSEDAAAPAAGRRSTGGSRLMPVTTTTRQAALSGGTETEGVRRQASRHILTCELKGGVAWVTADGTKRHDSPVLLEDWVASHGPVDVLEVEEPDDNAWQTSAD
eukprot:Cvel_18485.t1-p1 / transcript=Cvel_18485.t1 / gene=Cvel_18485 / organism=Chromera_velia_CCMP2878 / gene_product=hypothetical protein / transcript_product=hypothetical protein / location=Cvel_scaffold1533:2332-5712(-) / protein_length=982 / sequence_SO=supercontig / SO=protein_coding / is_pseudo=false